MTQTQAAGPNEFKCEACKQVFEKARTDAAAKAEAVANGYDPDKEDCGLVCDDCYRKHFMLLDVNGAATFYEETK